MSQRDRLRVIAMGFAMASLAIVLVAVIVVGHRGGAAPAEPGVVIEQPPHDQQVTAVDVVKLEQAVEAIGGGVHVTDRELQQRLGLTDDDVITSIDGRAIAVSDDIHEALFEIAMMKAQTLYVELLRDHGPALVRWRVEGDLRGARHDYGYTPSRLPPPPDPLLDTIHKVDDTHYTIPAATVQQLTLDPAQLARGARIVPAMKNGTPSGFKLYAIRPYSVVARFGIVNGDTVRTINGHDLQSASDAMDVYRQLHGATQVVIELERRGSPITLTISVN
jgi:type II secretory pathway component PulC